MKRKSHILCKCITQWDILTQMGLSLSNVAWYDCVFTRKIFWTWLDLAFIIIHHWTHFNVLIGTLVDRFDSTCECLAYFVVNAQILRLKAPYGLLNPDPDSHTLPLRQSKYLFKINMKSVFVAAGLGTAPTLSLPLQNRVCSVPKPAATKPALRLC